MRMFAFTVALAFVAVAAVAQEPPPPSDAPSHDMQRICAAQVRGQTRFYPERAQQRMLNGSAVLDCTLGADDALQTCQVVDETPYGYGFGEAALGVACLWEPGRTPSSATTYVDEATGARHMRRTVRFNIPGGNDSQQPARRGGAD